MANWSSGQNRILQENGNLGARKCRDLIHKQYGIYRSVEATERHAYRIGVSVMRYQTCPGCGRPVRKLNTYSGYCQACHYKQKAQEEREFNIKLHRELSGRKNGDDSHEYKKAYDALRQENSRLCRHNNLPNKQQRKCRKICQSAGKGQEKLF